MIITPTQIAFGLLCGYVPPMLNMKYRKLLLEEIIFDGQSQLVKLTNIDLKYDLLDWYNYLILHESSSFSYHGRSEMLLETAKEALKNFIWQNTVDKLDQKTHN
jgi:hypothetical protein